MTRLPSITEDHDSRAVINALGCDTVLPDWTERGTVNALIAHGYAQKDADGIVELTVSGVTLGERWKAIKEHTAAGFRLSGTFASQAGQK